MKLYLRASLLSVLALAYVMLSGCGDKTEMDEPEVTPPEFVLPDGDVYKGDIYMMVDGDSVSVNGQVVKIAAGVSYTELELYSVWRPLFRHYIYRENRDFTAHQEGGAQPETEVRVQFVDPAIFDDDLKEFLPIEPCDAIMAEGVMRPVYKHHLRIYVPAIEETRYVGVWVGQTPRADYYDPADENSCTINLKIEAAK